MNTIFITLTIKNLRENSSDNLRFKTIARGWGAGRALIKDVSGLEESLVEDVCAV